MSENVVMDYELQSQVRKTSKNMETVYDRQQKIVEASVLQDPLGYRTCRKWGIIRTEEKSIRRD